ncbi:aminotransferase class I/II-fold pyridoxal phosphate-dependent enzyme [Jannaschia sp. Os4]|uniref:pyridoxal phosphate-dependent aminotransferase n=1 Tax=Jannaschia sp. Os4 TaxID=2807617 RepID=UPI001939A13F|nr:aminotransferase class I/II-fold pyridoxal phosphate-dependent enzyme [Jannaschia sp. Os4]MBM2576897.1 aminotransferase class I/II-fold pyridoxal phosphate-dependent enzyme [Jannaschia sp. Os4]
MRASSRSEVDPFIVMDVLKAAQAAEAAGRDVVHMEVGQPGTGAPEAARRAVAKAMEAGPLGYTEGLGLPALRARIARLYADWYGVDLDPARVVVTSGSSAGFLLAFTACFDAGARVGLGLPGYPSYRAILKALSLEAVGIETHAPAYRVPPEAVAGLDGLIVASPGNPTGTMLDRDGMAEIAGACRDAGTTLVSDEIYHGLHHAHRAVSALEITDDAVVVNSFSKYFSMTGWRVGWLVVPEGMVRTFERLAQNMFICAPHASQVAALAAMDATAELEANRAVYAANRALMLERLPQAGLDRIGSPDGAFYVYADVSHLTDDSRAFCAELLEAGVAATPGLDFDPGRGHRTVRFSYARSTEEVARGLDRIAAFVAGRAAA